MQGHWLGVQSEECLLLLKDRGMAIWQGVVMLVLTMMEELYIMQINMDFTDKYSVRWK